MGAVADGYVFLIFQSLRLYVSASLPSLFLEHGFGRLWVPWNQQYPSKSFQNGTAIKANPHATQNQKPITTNMSHAQNTSVTLSGHSCIFTKHISRSMSLFKVKTEEIGLKQKSRDVRQCYLLIGSHMPGHRQAMLF